MTYYLGWGTAYFLGGPPARTPDLRANSGTASAWRESVQFGVDVRETAPPYGARVDYTSTYYPAGGGPEVVTEYPGYGNAFYWYDMYEPEAPFGPLAGVHEITAVVDGEPAGNKLVMVVTATFGSYSAQAWYAEDMTEPVTPLVWERRVQADET